MVGRTPPLGGFRLLNFFTGHTKMTCLTQVHPQKEAATPQQENHSRRDSATEERFPKGSFVVRRDMAPSYAYDMQTHTLTIILQLSREGQQEVVANGGRDYFQERKLEVTVGSRTYKYADGEIEVEFFSYTLILMKIRDKRLFEGMPERLFNPMFDHRSPADKFRFCFIYWSGSFHFAQGIVIFKDNPEAIFQ